MLKILAGKWWNENWYFVFRKNTGIYFENHKKIVLSDSYPTAKKFYEQQLKWKKVS